ncbi:rCG24193 [Rattus norvegicus]|uniref:RCG24193 n=1 Tax=Rattus norvegicus TaxID=10116 RepID=A6KAE7_RAT|nr:rCG24193 [Rattus norvegicus]
MLILGFSFVSAPFCQSLIIYVGQYEEPGSIEYVTNSMCHVISEVTIPSAFSTTSPTEEPELIDHKRMEQLC